MRRSRTRAMVANDERGCMAKLWRAIMDLLEKQDNFRHRVDFVLNATSYGAAIETLNVIISTAAVVLYCVATYYVRNPSEEEADLLQNMEDFQVRSSRRRASPQSVCRRLIP